MEAKCYFAVINDETPFQPTIMPVPRIGEKLFFEGQDPYYLVIDVQYQFRENGEKAEYMLVNIILKRKKKR